MGELSDALRAKIEKELRTPEAYLSDENLGDTGAVFVAEKLRGNTFVESLELGACGIGAVGARALVGTLGEHDDTLKTLDLYENSLGDEGAEAIALMLKTNTTLERLRLARCGIGARGARAQGEALTENATLKVLFLYDNDVGDNGAEAFAGTLRCNESLELLFLENCGLTDIGASSLFVALRESNSSLRQFYHYQNDINDDLKDSIKELVEENKAVVPASAERRARCLLFCCLKLAPAAHEHVVPSIGAVPVPVMQYAVEHAGSLHVAKRFEHGNAVAGQSSAGVRARSSSTLTSHDLATSRRR